MIDVRWPDERAWVNWTAARMAFYPPPACCRRHRVMFRMTAQWRRRPAGAQWPAWRMQP